MALTELISVLMLLVGIPWLCVACWVIKDAWGETVLAPFWGVGVFFTGPPGLMLYFAFGGPDGTPREAA